jgi:hypothetical protein
MTSTDDALQRASDFWTATERAKRIAKYERQLADPGRIYAGKPTRPHRWPEWQREEFREWAGDRFPAWYEQARARIAERENVRDFEAAWHPGGPDAYWAERVTQRVAQAVQTEIPHYVDRAVAMSDAELGAELRGLATAMANSGDDASEAAMSRIAAMMVAAERLSPLGNQ